jgi:hypothetical protein
MCTPECSKTSTLARGAIGIAKATLGINRADPDTVERRRVICRECPEAAPCVGSIVRRCKCNLCGCLIRAKTATADERCPGGRW